MILGVAVNGNNIYGTLPPLSRDSSDAVENNRIIPTGSVGQYGATLARWFDEKLLCTCHERLIGPALQGIRL